MARAWGMDPREIGTLDGTMYAAMIDQLVRRH